MSEDEEEERKSLIREKSTKLARGTSRKLGSSSKDTDTNMKTSKKSAEDERTKETEATEDERKSHRRREKQAHSKEEEKRRSREKREKQRRSKSKEGQNQSSGEVKSKRRRRRSVKEEKQKEEKQKNKESSRHLGEETTKSTKTRERKTKADEDTKADNKERIHHSTEKSKQRKNLRATKEKETNSTGKEDKAKIKSSTGEAEIEESDMERKPGTKTKLRHKPKTKDEHNPTQTSSDIKIPDIRKSSKDKPYQSIQKEKNIPHYEMNGEKSKVEPAPRNDFKSTSNAQFAVDDDILIGCAPYKQSVINKILKEAQNPDHPTKYNEIVMKLTEYGVTVYEIGYHATLDGGNLLGEVQGVAEEVSNRVRTSGGLQERCLLYIDKYGRPFNITIVGGSTGLIGAWKSSLSTFSGLEATIAISVLSRTFACSGTDIDLGVKPGYLGLLLGLVLSEEIALAHLHVAMLVWGAPSVCSYELLMHFSSDWPRKLVILVLAIASAAPEQDNIQKYLTLIGVAFAISVLAANLGSRAWFNLKLRPLRYSGHGNQILSALFAICTGLTVPYVGYREVVPGGEIAFLAILKNSVIVGVIFVLSDIDWVQKFIINGSEECNQDATNIIMGLWWSLSLLASLFLCGRIKKFSINPEDYLESNDQPLLVRAHDSPVGFKVRHIPDFPIDETLRVQTNNIFSVLFLRLLGLFIAVVGGIGILYLAFTDLDEKIMG